LPDGEQPGRGCVKPNRTLDGLHLALGPSRPGAHPHPPVGGAAGVLLLAGDPLLAPRSYYLFFFTGAPGPPGLATVLEPARRRSPTAVGHACKGK